MSVIKELESISDGADDVIFPPGDLYSDEPPLESDLHRLQINLLIESLEWEWRERNDFYASGNLTVYYSPNQSKSSDFRGPDFFVVLGVERKARKSWVVWQENGKYPHVIVEILSPTTAAIDRGLKKQIYQDTFRTPDYFWFEPNTLEFKGFHLSDGRYQEVSPNSKGWLWSQQLELYLGVYQSKLRFFNANGDLIPNLEEIAQQERQQREQAQLQAESERQQREQAQQKIVEIELMLARYREQFGELSQ
jgi:Uma2 family endonuclease